MWKNSRSASRLTVRNKTTRRLKRTSMGLAKRAECCKVLCLDLIFLQLTETTSMKVVTCEIHMYLLVAGK